MTPLRGEAGKKTYELRKELQSGATGDPVHLAWHRVFDGPCIQKTVHLHGLEDALARNEPAFLERLRHPHVVEVREAQFDPDYEGAITFVMPAYSGGSIEEALRDGYRFSTYQAIDLAVHALDALAYLYRDFNAVHRDVKPGNLLLRDEARDHCFLSDFGSAATVAADGCAAAVLGTDHYRPPEAKSTERVGVSADMFGIGMTLWEMLNGRLPWERHDLAMVERRLRSGRRALPDGVLRSYAPHVAGRIRRVVNKAIARDPRARHDSPEAMIRALNKVKTASVDWRHAEGDDRLGVWEGRWPSGARDDRRLTLQVTSRILRAGRNSGALRLEATYRRVDWANNRKLVSPATVSADDRSDIAAFFEQVEAKAAHRAPAS